MTFLDILLLLLIAAAAGYVASVIVATLCTFLITFVRTKPTKWTTTEDDKSPEKQAMYAFGRTWREEHADKMREVFVTNGGLRLHGEYYDFGFDKAVIVLLALLSLGVRNIHLGPTLPAFLSPNVLNTLVRKFSISGISNVDDDLRDWIR